MNEITIVGNAVTEPRLWTSPRGDIRATFRFAHNHRFFSKATNEWTDAGTTYVDVVCWRQLAEHVIETVAKGLPLIIVGALKVKQIPSQNDESISRTFVEIEATAIGPDLSKGIATFTRTKRPAVVEQESRAIADVTALAEVTELPAAAGF